MSDSLNIKKSNFTWEGKFSKKWSLKQFAEAYVKYEILYRPVHSLSQKELQKQRNIAYTLLQEELEWKSSRQKILSVCYRFRNVFLQMMQKKGHTAPFWAKRVATKLTQSGWNVGEAQLNDLSIEAQVFAAKVADIGWHRCTAEPVGGRLRHIWDAICGLVRRKLNVLTARGDSAMAASAIAMTQTDWLVADLMLMYGYRGRNALIDHETVRHYDQLQPLITLFHLTQMHELEKPCAPQQLAQRWKRALTSYSERGCLASLVLLQRRWFELKWQSRRRVLRYWQRHMVGKRTWTSRLPVILHLAIVKCYPHIVTKPMMSWSAMVEAGLVFTERRDSASSAGEHLVRDSRPWRASSPDIHKLSEQEDDLILIERNIETIELLDDNDDNNYEHNYMSDEPLASSVGPTENGRVERTVDALKRIDPRHVHVTVLPDSDSEDAAAVAVTPYGPVQQELDPEITDELLTKKPKMDPDEPSFRSRILFEEDCINNSHDNIEPLRDQNHREQDHSSTGIVDKKLLMEARVQLVRLDVEHLLKPSAVSDDFDPEDNIALSFLSKRIQTEQGVSDIRAVEDEVRRVAKRVELPDINEVRRVNRTILTAHVAPLCSGSGEAEEAPSPSPQQLDELLKMLNLLTRSSAGEVTPRKKYCCQARRHRAVNDARWRVAERVGRVFMPLTVHHHRSETPCGCCCLHLLREESPAVIINEQRWLDRHVRNLLAVYKSSRPAHPPRSTLETLHDLVEEMAETSEPDATSDADWLLEAPPTEENPDKTRAKNDVRKKRYPGRPPDVRAPEADYTYDEWTRQRNTYAKYFKLSGVTGNRKRKLAAAIPAPADADRPLHNVERDPRQCETKPVNRTADDGVDRRLNKLVLLVPHVARPAGSLSLVVGPAVLKAPAGVCLNPHAVGADMNIRPVVGNEADVLKADEAGSRSIQTVTLAIPQQISSSDANALHQVSNPVNLGPVDQASTCAEPTTPHHEPSSTRLNIVSRESSLIEPKAIDQESLEREKSKCDEVLLSSACLGSVPRAGGAPDADDLVASDSLRTSLAPQPIAASVVTGSCSNPALASAELTSPDRQPELLGMRVCNITGASTTPSEPSECQQSYSSAVRPGGGLVSVAQYLVDRDPTALRTLCCEAGQPIWTLCCGLYLVVVTVPYDHRLRRPDYYTFEPLERAARLVFPLPVEPSAPNHIDANNKRYKKLCDQPLRYAQVYCAVPSAAVARCLMFKSVPLLLMCARTADLFPVRTHNAQGQRLLALECERMQPLQDLVRQFAKVLPRVVQANINKRATIALLDNGATPPVLEIHSDEDETTTTAAAAVPIP